MLRRHFVVRRLGVLLVRLGVESPRYETVAVGIDEVAGNVFAQRGGRRSRQGKVHGAGLPERDVGPTDHRADLKAVTGQETLCCEHIEGIEVVVALRLAAPPRRPFEAFYQVVAAPEQCLVRRFKGPLPLSPLVQPANLLQRPPQTVPQPHDDPFQFLHEVVDAGAQDLRSGYVRIVLRPTLRKYAEHVTGQ